MCRKLQRPAIALLGALALLCCVRAADGVNPRFTGTPFMRTWTADDYGASPGNGIVVQHPRTGFIYVANVAGIMEFDGVRWRLVARPNGAISGLTIDMKGRV